MARKVSITKEMIVSSAFEMTREEGLLEVTARRLAAKAGCSTQPIFRVYQSMDELYDEIFGLAATFFADFYQNYPKTEQTPFVNLGLAYIDFAGKEPNLFRLLFMEEKRQKASLIGILNGKNNALFKEISKATAEGAKDAEDIFMRMWIFIHGAACMVITGDYDLTMEQTKKLLADSFHAFIK